MDDCRCPNPKKTEQGQCANCDGFLCPYAQKGSARCSPAICDCFIDQYPDSPFGLHPEAFIVGTHEEESDD